MDKDRPSRARLILLEDVCCHYLRAREPCRCAWQRFVSSTSSALLYTCHALWAVIQCTCFRSHTPGDGRHTTHTHRRLLRACRTLLVFWFTVNDMRSTCNALPCQRILSSRKQATRGEPHVAGDYVRQAPPLKFDTGQEARHAQLLRVQAGMYLSYLH